MKLKVNGHTLKTAAGLPGEPFPIQAAMSSMFGTVADTSMNRTNEPRIFMRLVTTSRVDPRDSLRI